jgi:predicted O-methyltransferase YrrM
MSSTLSDPKVASALRRLHAEAEALDPAARRGIADREAELGRKLTTSEKYAFYDDAPGAITPQEGELLYVLMMSSKPSLTIEFGTSFGISTIYLAAAINDLGRGSLITTEASPAKAELARENLSDAGLDDLVELREGDALESLKDLAEAVDFLFLDGRNDLYLPVLRLIEPCLVPGALVVGDLNDDPDLLPYVEHVRDGRHRYTSTTVMLGDGVEVSVRALSASA